MSRCTCEAPVVLREAVLKPQERAILLAVWRMWADGKRLTHRGIAKAAGAPLSTCNGWMYGPNGPARCGFIERGWLAREPHTIGTLRPGLRFAGVQGDRIYEAVQ